MQIEKRSKIKLRPPQFKCDKVISGSIESPLPNTAFFMAIIGSAGSGKTSVMLNLLTQKDCYKKAFDRVHVVIPSHSVASMKSDVLRKHDKVYDELTYDVLDRVLASVRDDAEGELNSLLVLDDVTTMLKDGDIQRQLKDAIFNRRHYRLSIIILVQSYIAMPLSLRKTLSHFVAFKPRNKKEFAAIFQEIVFLDRETADNLLRFVYKDRYSFMFCDIERTRFYRNFDLVRLHNNEEAQEQEQEQAGAVPAPEE